MQMHDARTLCTHAYTTRRPCTLSRKCSGSGSIFRISISDPVHTTQSTKLKCIIQNVLPLHLHHCKWLWAIQTESFPVQAHCHIHKKRGFLNVCFLLGGVGVWSYHPYNHKSLLNLFQIFIRVSGFIEVVAVETFRRKVCALIKTSRWVYEKDLPRGAGADVFDKY